MNSKLFEDSKITSKYKLFRPDDIIKSLVYKVVPALYQSECQKTKKFNKLHNIQHNGGDDSTMTNDASTDKSDENKPSKQHYFSPDEPIR